MSIRSNPLHPNEIFPQMSHAQVKQNEALEKAKAFVCQQNKHSLGKPQLNVTLSPTRCTLEINRNGSFDDHHYSKQSAGQVKKSLGQFNKDRLSMPQQHKINEKKTSDPISLMDQKLLETQKEEEKSVDHHLLQFSSNNEIKLRIKAGDESKLSAQPSAETINAISNSIDVLNVPLPPAVI